jgi:hypothetical protein
MTRSLPLAVAAATLLAAADISGNWIGSAEFVNRGGETRTTPMHLCLKQEGDLVKGTAGPAPEKQKEIEDGRFSAGKLTFQLTDPGGKVLVELTLDGDAMKGEAKFHREYGVIPAKLALRRE